MKDNENRNNGFRKGGNKPVEKAEPNPVAVLLLNIIKEQVRDFVTLAPEERFEGSKDLYYVGSYPAVLDRDVVTDAANYSVYQLERAVRLPKDDPERMNRLSTAILLVNKDTGEPAFYLTSYITPKMVANIRIVPYNDRGAMYRQCLSWDSRDDEPKKTEEVAEEVAEPAAE